MKNLICLILVFAAASLASAEIILVEDYEGGVAGESLYANGWLPQYGTDGNDVDMITSDSAMGTASPIDSGGSPFTGYLCTYLADEASGDALRKLFDQTNTLPDSGDIYLSVETATGGTGYYGPCLYATGVQGPSVGIEGTNLVLWQVGQENALAGTSSLLSNWTYYDVVLQMSINAGDITQSTGTVYYREITSRANSKFVADPALTNINLGLTSANKPSTWTGWFLRVHNSQGSNDMILGTGSAVDALPDGPILTVDFENLNIGDDLSLDNWGPQWGGSQAFPNWQIPVPATGIEIASWASQTYTQWAQGGSYQACRLFDGGRDPNNLTNAALLNTLTGAEETLYLKCDGRDFGYGHVGVGNMSRYDGFFNGPTIGFAAADQLMICPVIGSTPDQINGTAGLLDGDTRWELCLIMDVNTVDISASTGTLYYREYGTGNEGVWLADPLLVDIDLGFRPTKAYPVATPVTPVIWNGWYLRNAYHPAWDNLEFGVGRPAGVWCVPPEGDVNEDCTVDVDDIKILSDNWLTDTLP